MTKTKRLVAAAATIALALASASAALAQNKTGQDKMAGGGHAMGQSRYGGPVYSGQPALSVTASLVEAGGGPAKFSIARALTAMVGPKLVTAEVAKLTKQYGKDKVASWLTIFDFAVKDGLNIATKAGVKLPKGNLRGKQLAATLVKAGLDKDGTFYTEYMLDKAVSHDIHMQVMENIDAKYGQAPDAEYHRITNQAMYDLAHALGAKSVKLARFH